MRELDKDGKLNGDVIDGILSQEKKEVASSLFLFGAAIEWIAGAPDAMAYQCLGLGLFFLIAPHIANWIVDKVVDLLYFVLSFISQ